MEPDTDLRSELAPLFRDEPPAPTVQHFVASGRRRLRQRRIGQTLGVTVAVVALATGYAVATAGSNGERSLVTDSSSPDGPQPPEPTATTTYDSIDDEADEDRVRGFSVDETTGEVTAVAGGKVITSLTLDEITGHSGAVAVDVVLDGDETWWYVDWSKNGNGSTNTPAQPEQPFSEWAQRMHQAQQGGEGNPPSPVDLVEIDQYGHYTLGDGVEVLDVIENPFHLAAPYSSVAIDVRKGDKRQIGVFLPDTATFGDPATDTLQDVLDQARSQGPSYSASGPMPPLWDFGPDRMPVLQPGVEVVDKVANPLGVERPRRSIAWVLRFDGKTWWALWEMGPSTYSGAQTIRVAGDGYATFQDWLADQKVQAEW